MTDQNCANLDLLAYLRGSLDASEALDVELHLRSCPECQAELVQLREAEGVLPFALKPVSPPDFLRSQVLAEAFSQRPPASNNCDSEVPTQRRRASRFAFRQWFPWSVSAALLIICVVLAQQVVNTKGQVNTLKHQLADSTTAVALQPTNYLATAQGHAIVIPAHDGVQLIVYISDVKPTEGSEVYHVWLWNKGVRASAGTLTVNQHGTGVLEVSLRGTNATFDGIGITLEPNATTKVPTGPKVLGSAKL